ncbi:alpha/beta fold hydrolase [Gangjinia marincola]|uniref:Alpha/beta fold hydrolase n=1 Tax=Gangjinia marincola TaxID=578463 RepID=A0ABP3XVY5_9FLAO
MIEKTPPSPLQVGKMLNRLAKTDLNKAAQQAFNIFCSPQKGKLLPQQEEYLSEYKAQLHHIEHNDIQTYHWPGERETILLIHGWESNTARWKEFLNYLQPLDYNIIALDAPAHGASSGSILNVPLYSATVRKLVELHDPSYVIGHSIGGMTAIFHQYRYPDNNVEKIIALAPPGELSEIMHDYQQLLQLDNAIMSALEELFVDQFGFTFDQFSIPKFSGYLQQNGLLFHDPQDAIAPISSSQSIAFNWDKASLIETPQAGHSLHRADIYKQMVDFLEA